MTLYEVYLDGQPRPIPVFGQKFCCEDSGLTVFYARGPDNKFEEVACFKSANVKKIEEIR